jgi:hypothetical protein
MAKLDFDALKQSKNWVNGSGEHPDWTVCLGSSNTKISSDGLSDDEWVFVDPDMRPLIKRHFETMGRFGAINFLHEVD